MLTVAGRRELQKTLDAAFGTERRLILKQMAERAARVVEARRMWTATGQVVLREASTAPRLRELTIAGHGEMAPFTLPSLDQRLEQLKPGGSGAAPHIAIGPPGRSPSTILRHPLERFEQAEVMSRRPRRS